MSTQDIQDPQTFDLGPDHDEAVAKYMKQVPYRDFTDGELDAIARHVKKLSPRDQERVKEEYTNRKRELPPAWEPPPHRNKGIPLLVFATITHFYPEPPPIDDDPPFHVFMFSIGMMIGRLLGKGHFTPPDAAAAGQWIAGKTSPEEVIKLIWNR